MGLFGRSTTFIASVVSQAPSKANPVYPLVPLSAPKDGTPCRCSTEENGEENAPHARNEEREKGNVPAYFFGRNVLASRAKLKRDAMLPSRAWGPTLSAQEPGDPRSYCIHQSRTEVCLPRRRNKPRKRSPRFHSGRPVPTVSTRTRGSRGATRSSRVRRLATSEGSPIEKRVPKTPGLTSTQVTSTFHARGN